MFTYLREVFVRTVLVAFLAFSPAMLAAEPLVPLPAEKQEEWSAVGHLKGPGFRMKRGCTATLVAPNLIVTAAHCLTGAFGNPNNQKFQAGLSGDAAVATRSYLRAGIRLHPLYSARNNKGRLHADIAVVELAEPISAREIKPIPVASDRSLFNRQATLLGYRHDHPKVLSGRSGCKLISPASGSVLRYNCEVFSGISGGPVMVKTEQGPQLVGVITARHNQNGDALVVPVSTWLRGIIAKRTQN